MGSSLGLFFDFFICSSQKCKMKTETAKLYICKFATLISQERPRQLQLFNQSPRPACLLDFVFVLIFFNDHKKTHLIYESIKYKINFYGLFTPVASIDANLSEQKKAFTYKNRVQLLHDWLGTLTWPPFHCFGTPIIPS